MILLQGEFAATTAHLPISEEIASRRLAMTYKLRGWLPLRQMQAETQVELDAFLPSVLRPQGGAFKGEL